MRTCAYCSRPANTSLNVRDDYERVHTIYVCDAHSKPPKKEPSQKDYMEDRYDA